MEIQYIHLLLDEGRDAFIPPKPYNSWLLDETTCQWKAPVDYPADENQYAWDESTLSWVQLEQFTPE